MQARSERFEMRLDLDTLEEVDRWRDDQDDLPSRAEAFRRLVEAGIAHSRGPRFSTSGTEKLILLMLCELYKRLGVEGELDADFIENALYGGHGWGLEWRYGGIFRESEHDERTVEEVVRILEMWSAIERSFERLTDTERARLKTEAVPFGEDARFPGFDGNNESEHGSIARFMVKDLERFPEFAGREDLNSHMPTLVMHRRMLAKFTKIRPGMKRGMMGVPQMIDMMRAMDWKSGT